MRLHLFSFLAIKVRGKIYSPSNCVCQSKDARDSPPKKKQAVKATARAESGDLVFTFQDTFSRPSSRVSTSCPTRCGPPSRVPPAYLKRVCETACPRA